MNRRTFLKHSGVAAVAAPLTLRIHARAASPPAPRATAAHPFISRTGCSTWAPGKGWAAATNALANLFLVANELNKAGLLAIQ